MFFAHTSHPPPARRLARCEDAQGSNVVEHPERFVGAVLEHSREELSVLEIVKEPSTHASLGDRAHTDQALENESDRLVTPFGESCGERFAVSGQATA